MMSSSFTAMLTEVCFEVNFETEMIINDNFCYPRILNFFLHDLNHPESTNTKHVITTTHLVPNIATFKKIPAGLAFNVMTILYF